jgi:GNAT superfamily N-acetyltransferase
MARFVPCDPDDAPASELLVEMEHELNAVYETVGRLHVPAVTADDLRPPNGLYVVGWEGDQAVAGGGLRRWSDEVAEIKRMYVRPPARARGLAAELLAVLEAAAASLGYRSARLDTGPRQQHAARLYRHSGYVEIDPYNDNPFASFWGEKVLAPPT